MTTEQQNPMSRDYSIAFVREDGGWDIVEQIHVIDSRRISNEEAHKRANETAEENYPGGNWYVLDANGNNING